MGISEVNSASYRCRVAYELLQFSVMKARGSDEAWRRVPRWGRSIPSSDLSSVEQVGPRQTRSSGCVFACRRDG